MTNRPDRRSPWPWALCLALLLLPGPAPPAAAAAPRAPPAAAPASAPLPGAAARPVLLADWKAFFTDKTTLIQIGVIVGAIGIFLLTRAVR